MTRFVKFAKATQRGRDMEWGTAGSPTIAVNPDRVLHVSPMGGGICCLQFGDDESLAVGGSLDEVLDKLEGTDR